MACASLCGVLQLTGLSLDLPPHHQLTTRVKIHSPLEVTLSIFIVLISKILEVGISDDDGFNNVKIPQRTWSDLLIDNKQHSHYTRYKKKVSQIKNQYKSKI